MIWLDFAIIGIIAIAALVGLSRGLTKELLSIGAWIAAFFIAAYGAGYIAPEIESLIKKDGCVSYFAAFVALFFAALIVIGLFNWLLGMFLLRGKRTLVDRIFGLLFGLGKGILIVLIALTMVKVLELPIDKWWPGSQLTPELAEAVDQMYQFTKDTIEKNLSDFDCDKLKKRQDS